MVSRVASVAYYLCFEEQPSDNKKPDCGGQPGSSGLKTSLGIGGDCRGAEPRQHLCKGQPYREGIVPYRTVLTMDAPRRVASADAARYTKTG